MNHNFVVRANFLDDHKIVTLQSLAAVNHHCGAFGIAKASAPIALSLNSITVAWLSRSKPR
jgi:hypothetical protein